MKQRLALTSTFSLSVCITAQAQVTIGPDKALLKAALSDLKTQDDTPDGFTITTGKIRPIS